MYKKLMSRPSRKTGNGREGQMEIEPTLFWILLNKSIGIIYVGKAVIIFQKNLNTFFKRQLFYKMVRDEDKKGDAKHLQLK